ncbi:RagB/SusD family nutrient uptake outer membrane protein [Flavobacterium zepuense]|uniref:RagB/SusD family nutrient uptake outer membrane protein n=1 Tax=Flavobacterium zepuense TaxID=2593302 RepID=A0A552V073_9FLAO|nr:RagB/SusD family nutrient uptake outer membrane protein [Flavobacterium zepuense]TRW23875.1 RagB/SusD family nutrient uptake outer membrane protein [Flavobacterium zepuense]
MKIYNKRLMFVNLAALMLAMGTLQSCHDEFLDEELTTARGNDYYETEDGIISLSIGAYQRVLAQPFGNELQYVTTNYGTDEFTIGGDDSNGTWNRYNANLQSIVPLTNSNTVGADWQWDYLYIGVNICNRIIINATEIQSTNPAVKEVALGEGYFFRAFSYLRLVSQYGGVPIKLTVSTAPEVEFTRATPAQVYDQIIADFNQSLALLPDGGGPSKVTKDAARHYLAKALLSRASEINDSWNSATKVADLNQVKTLCDQVISSHPLATNFGDLWKFTAPNGASETLPEIILSAQFTNDLASSSVNIHHMMFTSKYDDLPMMKRDLTGMRPYTRLAPTYFTYEAFDVVNDSRLWKSFRTKHRLNNASGDYYTNGDLGIMYIINDKDDTSFAQRKYNNVITYAATGKTIPSVYVAHSTSGELLLAEPRFPSLSKHYDASRIGVNETRGFRDVTLARSAETYLMAAEAEIRLASVGSGSYATALTYINAVRERAAYKDGEIRSEYTDGGAAYTASTAPFNVNERSYMPENSYYESTHISPTTAATVLTVSDPGNLPDEDLDIIATLGISGEYNRMLCFLLNERTRELCGEYHRWEDLSRTKTLESRARAYNASAAPNIQEHHNLRPIPQTFLDLIFSNGSPLTPEQKQAMQNPGY